MTKILKHAIGILSFVFILVALLNACANEPIGTTTAQKEYSEFVDDKASQKPEVVEVPEDVNAALLDAASEVRGPEIIEPLRFDVSVNDVPARAFFVSLVSQAGVNVVAHPDIEGNISLNLRNVTVDEVLDVVRDVYGYEYQKRSGIYTIYPRKLRTQVFPIDYLDVQRVGVTDTSVFIGQATSSSGSGNNSGGNSNQSSQGSDSANLLNYLDLGGDAQNQEDLTPGTRVQTLNATDFWSRLRTTLSGIIGGESDGRFVMVNAQAGMVVVRALPVELSTVRDFLEKSELSVQRQVILETKILEVQLNDRYETGINWAAISGELLLETTISGQGRIQDVLLGGDGVTDNLFSSAIEVTDITKLIDLLDRQGDVQVLSSPRISTVNNQKAVIRVGSDEYFVTGLSNSTTASAATVTNVPTIELSPFFSGISLDVTPQIGEDGEVILHVHPIVTDVKDQQKEIQLGSENFSLPLALRDVRESDSIVKASTGQVVVLGGLMQETSVDVVTKRGFLGDIPVVNVFFKHTEKALKKTELVILMRPVVVENDDVWAEQVESGQRPFDTMGRE